MRLIPLSLALVLFLAACSPSDSGIEGHMTAGPTCPVVRIDTPCPDKPFEGTVTVLSQSTGFRLASVTADASGYFRVNLAPGTYVLQPESTGTLPRAAAVVVQVLPHQFTQQDIVYDTGIR